MSHLHTPRISVGGYKPVSLGAVQTFDLTTDMLEMADPFSVSMPFHLLLWDAFETDAEVELYIDDNRVLSGFVDRRERLIDKFSSTLTVTGRDRGGRLVDESAPLVNHVNKGVLELAKEMTGDWFESVSLSNAENRRLIGGRGKALAGVSSEPAIVTGRDIVKKVEPGETRSQVLQSFLEPAGLLAWSSSNGRQFIVGKPNYDQAPQYRFFVAAPGSNRRGETNVMSLKYSEDVSELYQEYRVCGSSRGNRANYGKNVMRHTATVDGDVSPVGTILFRHPKRLIIADDDIKSAKEAKERAERERDLRFSGAFEFEVSVDNWGQAYKGDGDPVIYAFDKVATLEDEEADTVLDCLITRVQFSESKGAGQRATVSMVPLGTELVF